MPAPIPSPAKRSPWRADRRPEGSGRPAVRAISASCVRSCTWFSAEAPQDRSMTPASISRPCAPGELGPSGAVSMKPAAAETSTSSTMPNFESSAYAPIRAKTAMLPPPRSAVATLGKARLGHRWPAPRGGQEAHRTGSRRGPHHHPPERVADGGVGGADRRVEPEQHRRDAEGHLHDGEQRRGRGRARQRCAAAGDAEMDEEPEQQDPEPAVGPVQRRPASGPARRRRCTAGNPGRRAPRPNGARSRPARAGRGARRARPGPGARSRGRGGWRGPRSARARARASPPKISRALTRCAVLIRSGSFSSTVIAPSPIWRGQEREQRQPMRRIAGRSGAAHRHDDRGHDEDRGERRHEAVAVLDEHVGAERRDHAAVTERPVRAGQPRSRRADHVADAHQEEYRHHRRPSTCARIDPARVSGHGGLDDGQRRRDRRPPASGRTRRRWRRGRRGRREST